MPPPLPHPLYPSQGLVRHGTLPPARYEARVFREYTGGVARGRRLPRGAPRRELALGNVDAQLAVRGVDRDRITFSYQRERAADRRLRCHMPHHEAVRAAGKPSVGDQPDGVTKTWAD